MTSEGVRSDPLPPSPSRRELEVISRTASHLKVAEPEPEGEMVTFPVEPGRLREALDAAYPGWQDLGVIYLP
jgi:hypothetical protein